MMRKRRFVYTFLLLCFIDCALYLKNHTELLSTLTNALGMDSVKQIELASLTLSQSYPPVCIF